MGQKGAFLCPHKPCKRSNPGSGFKRRDQLTVHLKTCKIRRRLQQEHDANPLDLSQTPETEFESPGPQFQVAGSTAEIQQRPLASDTDDDASADLNFVSELKRRYGEKKAELEAMEKECEKKRVLLSQLEAVIKSYDSTSD